MNYAFKDIRNILIKALRDICSTIIKEKFMHDKKGSHIIKKKFYHRIKQHILRMNYPYY
jgi:hypothetical protein